MYPVSDAYKAAMRRPVQRFRMTGTVGAAPFTDENILAGSFSITNQCCGSGEIQIGQVYVGELNATFLNLPLQRYSLQDMEIRPVFGMGLEDGSWEDVPLGVFRISEASWTASGLVVKAYDNMALLDRNCNARQSSGTAYEMAQLAMKSCRLTLGTSEEEFRSFANGAEPLSLYAENDIETWRDFLSWLAQTVGCNVTAGRDGSILFRPYHRNAADTFDEAHRFEGGSFSDFETRYTGVSCVNLSDKMTKYYGMEEDTGLTYNLGTNPFLQYGVDETKDGLRRGILTALQEIDYVPFQCAMIGNPAYDLMDVFRFTGGIADERKLFCMTKFDFKYGSSYEMEGVGKNPALASARSKEDKNISGLLNQVEQGKLGITTFLNAAVYTLGPADVCITDIRFATNEENHLQFFGQVVVEVKADPVRKTAETGGTDQPVQLSWQEDGQAVCTVTFELNDKKIEIHHPAETWHSGVHTLNLYYPIEKVTPNFTNTFRVFLRMSGGTGKIDTGGCIASVSGQAMAAEEAWDGKIDLQDSAERFGLDAAHPAARGFRETMEKQTMERMERSWGDHVSGRTPVGGFCRPVEIK